MRRVIFLFATLALSACSGGDVTSLTGASTPVPATPVWSVAVDGCVKASDCNALRAGLVFNLSTAKLLQHALAANAPAPLSLGVAVVHLHVVPVASRSTYGIVAGRNELTAIVTLKTAAGATLRSFKVTVKGGGYPTDDTIEDAYRQFDADVIAALKS